jgi:hypothetical protein
MDGGDTESNSVETMGKKKKVFPCRHTCSGCTYVAPREGDRSKHESTSRRHRFCNESCNSNGALKKPNIIVHTPDTFLAVPPKGPSRSASVSTASSTSKKRLRPDSPTPSVSSSSSRKRSREATPEDSEETWKREKAKRTEVISKIKLCCVLDPSRAAQTRKRIEGHFCWVETPLPGGIDEVDRLVSSEELEGFVFHHPDQLDSVIMYEWVSHQF